MAKIVLVGAGSHFFTRNLVTDIVSYPALGDSTIALMDVAKEPLGPVTAFAKKIVEQHGFATKIESTTDRREALDGADYVITTFQVGGSRAAQTDEAITTKYGLDEAVSDTIGPGGVFYGTRNVPAILEICHDMEELCPRAWLLNHCNPMAIISWVINDYTPIKNVGLCHSIIHTAGELARYLGFPAEELSYWVAGVNHMPGSWNSAGAVKTFIPCSKNASRTLPSIRGPMRTGRGPIWSEPRYSRLSDTSSANQVCTCRPTCRISASDRNSRRASS